jgi:hypothetical protein
MEDKAYLRFSVLNRSDAPYRVLKTAVGALDYERKFFIKRESGSIEFPSELVLYPLIRTGVRVFGVVVFDYRCLEKAQKPVFRIYEDTPVAGSGRDIEIKGFRWFK